MKAVQPTFAFYKASAQVIAIRAPVVEWSP